MGKFTFSRSGRKKSSVPQVTVTEPMSKAHKILGSTPLSIDAPVCFDDTASSAVSVGTLESPALSNVASDQFSLDDHVRIAGSEEEFGDGSDSSPSHLRFNAIGGKGYGNRHSAGALKKTHSSSTIKSWYEKPKQLQQHSISRQSSTPVLARGLSKAHRVLDGGDDPIDLVKTKKKPPKLDFSNLVPSTRLSKKEPNGQLNGVGGPNPNHMIKSPSILSPFSQASGRQSDMRTKLKRRTKESLRSLFPDTPSTIADESNRRARLSDNGLSTLYDHYEQMTLRQVLRQDLETQHSPLSQRYPSDGQEEIEWREPEVEHDLEWLHKPPHPPTPQTAIMPKSECSTSPGDGDRSVSSRHTRTSRASKQTERSLQEADFHDKSVLMLSSDSEEDVEVETSTKSRNSTAYSTSNRPRSELSDNNLAPPPDTRRSKNTRRRPSPGGSSKRSSKKASFAPANTYITIPIMEDNRTPRQLSRSDLSQGGSSRTSSSPRESLISSNSTVSGMTCQIGYGTEETDTMTVLPARRPSQAELEQISAPSQPVDQIMPIMPHEPVAASSHQITPPLSPTSVDFYLRSVHSTMNGSGNQNRMMALTPQEEMLISALRKKNQAMRGSARAASENQVMHERQSSLGRNSTASQATVTETSVFDFDFPVPPNHKKKKQRQSEATVMLAESDSSTPKNEAFSQSDEDGYQASYLPPRESASQKGSLEKASQGSLESPQQQDVPVFLDEGKPVSDWSHLEEDDSDLDDFLPTSWGHSEENHTTQGDNVSPKAESQPEHLPSNCASPTSTRLAALAEDDDEDDMPRPDSPVSPDSFPPVPQQRTTVRNMARLSAVGYVRKSSSNEPGWWGDDD